MSNTNDAISLKDTQPAAQGNAKAGSVLSSLSSFFPIILIFFVFYFLILRPQEKKRKQKEELVNTVKKGEDILTHSGIFGTVTKVSDDTIDLEIAKNVTIKVLKQSIATILNRKDPNESSGK